ncbi:MAG TPA: hypothetical protein VGF38_14040 [Ktedonobacterales bacterium]|jgi:uncharacterized membrane protein HdeD (DUF308 family)
MIALTHAWWVAMMRGIAAITIALIVLSQAHVSMTTVAAALGAYILVDGIVALTGGIAVGLGMCGLVLLAEGLIGVTVAAVSLSDIRIAPHNIHVAEIPMVAWAGVMGVAEVYIGIQFGRELSANRGAIHRYALPPARACLLVGVVAIAFAVSLLILPMTSAGIAVPVIGLFAAALGYLRIRSGLALGSLHLDHFYSPT